jgi:arylsulfatase A-like enzyme
LFAILVLSCDGHEAPEATRPNILVVMTDDQDAKSLLAMPSVRQLIRREGTSFSQALVSYPLCCPARATFLTGEYAHNNGVQGNNPGTDGGGYASLIDPGRNLAAWLKRGGYATAHVGRWLNAFPRMDAPPPGWTLWRGELSPHTYYHSIFYRPSGPIRLGDRPRDYEGRVVTRIGARFISRNADGRRPFFLFLGYLAPHTGRGRNDYAGLRCGEGTVSGAPVRDTAQPDPKDAHAFEHAPLPRPPSFNEPDLSDKPSFLQRPAFNQLTVEEITRRYRCRLASLRAVDRGVRTLVDELDRTGQLHNTVILLTSDHGLMAGQHRLPGDKDFPYEESIRVPLLISGPGIPAGARVDDVVMNADLAPTILDLAGVEQPAEISRPQDGRSLVPLLRGEAGWPSRAILIEGRIETAPAPGGGFQATSYQGVRTARYLYVEWHTKRTATHREGSRVELGGGPVVARELYDLKLDPYETESVVDAHRYAAPRDALQAALGDLADCSGSSCQVDPAVPPLRR